MNYIVSQINRKINLLYSIDKKQELKTHLQSKLEFYLIYILGYLWNKNFDLMTSENKEEVINMILKPSIGSVISVTRKLDINSELFGNKKLKNFISAINSYPEIRNEQIGHGYSFEDNIENCISIFEELLSKIEITEGHDIFDEHDLILVNAHKNKVYSGISFKPNGFDYTAWSCLGYTGRC